MITLNNGYPIPTFYLTSRLKFGGKIISDKYFPNVYVLIVSLSIKCTVNEEIMDKSRIDSPRLIRWQYLVLRCCSLISYYREPFKYIRNVHNLI